MAEQFKPKLRWENEIDFRSGITNIIRRTVEDVKNYPFKSCINCSFFVENTSYCKKWNSRPPPRVIVFACDEHDDMAQVPF